MRQRRQLLRSPDRFHQVICPICSFIFVANITRTESRLKFEGERMQQNGKPQQNDPRMDALLDWFVDNWEFLTRDPNEKATVQNDDPNEPGKSTKTTAKKSRQVKKATNSETQIRSNCKGLTMRGMVRIRVTGLWRHVSNVPGLFGTLETCRHSLLGQLFRGTHTTWA